MELSQPLKTDFGCRRRRRRAPGLGGADGEKYASHGLLLLQGSLPEVFKAIAPPPPPKHALVVSAGPGARRAARAPTGRAMRWIDFSLCTLL